MGVVALMSGVLGEKDHNAYKEVEGAHRRHDVDYYCVFGLYDFFHSSAVQRIETIMLFSTRVFPSGNPTLILRGLRVPTQERLLSFIFYILASIQASNLFYNTISCRVVLCCKVEAVEGLQGHFLSLPLVEEALFPQGGQQGRSLGIISPFGTRPSFYHPVQHSFSHKLRYFREHLQGLFQWIIWGVRFLVKGSSFHLENLLRGGFINLYISLDISFQLFICSVSLALVLQFTICILLHFQKPFLGSLGKVFGILDLDFQHSLRILLSDPFIYIHHLNLHSLILCCIISMTFCVATISHVLVLFSIGGFSCLDFGTYSPRHCTYLLLLYIIQWIYGWLRCNVFLFTTIFR